MAEEATQVSEQDTSAEQTAADSQSEQQTTDASHETQEGSEQKQDGKAEPTAAADQSASTGDKSKSEDQDSKVDSKPLSRRSAAYRIQQLVEENKTLREQAKPKEQDPDAWSEEPRADEQPDIAALVAKEVEKRLNPVINESSKTADDGEINELFSGERASERSQYEGKIREMWKLPQYKDVAALDLYAMLRGQSIDAIVSKAVEDALAKTRQADKEAKESSASGNSNTNRTGKTKSVADMTDEELLAQNERVKAGLPV